MGASHGSPGKQPTHDTSASSSDVSSFLPLLCVSASRSVCPEWQTDPALYFSLLPPDLQRKVYALVRPHLPWTMRPDCALAVRKFNVSVWEALCWLESERAIDGSSEAVARFLTEAPGLSRARVGELLATDRAKLVRPYVARLLAAPLPYPVAVNRVFASFEPARLHTNALTELIAAEFVSLLPRAADPFASTFSARRVTERVGQLYVNRSQGRKSLTREEWVRVYRTDGFCDEEGIDPEQILGQCFDLFMASASL